MMRFVSVAILCAMGSTPILACEKNFANLDAAQNELAKVADRFNLQIRAFKAKG